MKSKSTMSLLIFAAATIAFAACSKKGSSSASTDAVAVQDMGTTPAGLYAEVSKLSLEQEKERYTLGCKIVGSPGAVAKTHPHLRVGDQITYSFAQANQTAAIAVNIHSRVAEISSDRIVEDSVIESGKNLPVPAGTNFKMVCSVPNGKTGGECKTEPELPQSQTGDSICYVKSNNSVAGRSVGSYTTKSGAKIKVYRSQHTSTGDVYCQRNGQRNAVLVGQGSEETIELRSNEAIFDKFFYCGGATVFAAQRVTLSNGKVVFSSRMEVTDMPVVR
jgi:hypothetical protein